MRPWQAAVLGWGMVLATPVSAEPLLLVPVSGGAQIQVIDTRSGSTAAQIPVADTPIGIALDTLHGKVYVAHQLSQRISKIDARTRRLEAQLQLPADAWGIALSPDGARTYVALSGSNQLGIVDTANLQLLGSVAVGSAPRNVVVSPDGTRIYVSNQFGGSVSIVDAVQQTLLGTFALCSGPLGMALRADGTLLYATCAQESSVVRFDTTSHTVVGSTATGGGPSDVLISPDGSRIYVSATSANTVEVIDTASHAVLSTIAVDEGPYGMSLSADGARLYVSNVHAASVQVIVTQSLTVSQRYPLVAAAFAVGHFLAPAGVPEPPLIGTPQGGNGHVRVNFTAPIFDGGSVITGYTASCGNVQQSGSPPSIVVTGLVSGASYSCTVRASNAIGESLPSAAVEVIAATVPGAPLLIQATPAAAQAILVFDPPSDDGGSAITQYTANCSPDNVQATGSASPLLLNGLTDNVVYRCSVSASNALGAGPASSELSVIPGNYGNSADLNISKNNAADFVGGGQRVAYLISVHNTGPAAVTRARVSDVLEAYFSDAQWICESASGARCAAAEGSGDLESEVDLPVNSSVQFQLSAVLAPLPEEPVFNLASVAVPAQMLDPDLGNNIATDGPDLRGVFRNGFE